MENLADRIAAFLASSISISGSDSISDSDSGSGSGSGSGSDSGSGSISGSGSGYGSGSGDGYGYGYGYGYGSGDGHGYGYNVSSINGSAVQIVDGVSTVFYSVRGNVARGAILNQDLTLTPTYIVRVGDRFAHGESIETATRDATQKHNLTLPIPERINAFLAQFDLGQKHSVGNLINGHRMLTGSCESGCIAFARNCGLSLDDQLTITEFIEKTLTKYGGDVIRELKSTIEANDA